MYSRYFPDSEMISHCKIQLLFQKFGKLDQDKWSIFLIRNYGNNSFRLLRSSAKSLDNIPKYYPFMK